jgi:hypothetical protein
MLKKLLLGVCVFLGLAGCVQCATMRSEYFDIAGKVYRPKPCDTDITIYSQALERPYAEIGVVKVLARRGTPRRVVYEEMKKRARAAGGDAIIEVQYGEDSSNDLLLCGRFARSTRNVSAVGRVIVFPEDE